MKKEQTNFRDIYTKLNPAQRVAVDTIDGPVMVVAGPGTGKTHVLSARIANILQKTDTPPYAILALTFTQSSASNMRRRVVEMIGKAGYYVNISTFHAFCSDIIQSHPEYFPVGRGSEPLNELERYDIFQTIIKKTKLTALKPINAVYFYLREIARSISDLKREGVSVDSFAKVVDQEYKVIDLAFPKMQLERLQKQKQKNQELAQLYDLYQKELTKRRRYDFDDMIALVVETFSKNKELLRQYQERLLYFLVDEYQDTNTAQNTVVELLASYWGERANLFVVGDPHQSIYRFQGASVENALSFIHKFPKAKLITLDTGYRSSQNLYDGAHAVIQNNTLTAQQNLSKAVEERLEKALTHRLASIHKKNGLISLTDYPSQTLETVGAAQKVKSLIASGVAPEEIAVLYRNNADSYEIQQTLAKFAIPYEIQNGENILQTDEIRQLLQLLRVIVDIATAKESKEIYEVMMYQWIGLDPLLVMKIARAASKAKTTIVELLDKGYDEFIKHHGSPDTTQIDFSIATSFIAKLKTWNIANANMIFTEWFEMVLEESGYLKWVLSSDEKIRTLTSLNSLYREIKAMTAGNHGLKLSGFLEAINTMQEYNISISAQDLDIANGGSIHLSTVHKAKGKEWEHVFLIQCIDGKWGNARKYDLISLPSGLLKNTDLSKKEQNEDERRLFYVALTRAKKAVHISYPQTIVNNSTSRDTVPSMFLYELGDYITEEKDEKITQNAERYLRILLSPQSKVVTIDQEAFFRELVKNFRLSVTALNTYLRDPKEFMEDVLLRVPRVKPEYMAFGTAVHFALEKFYTSRQRGEILTLQQLHTFYKESLSQELLHSTDFERRLVYGQEVLRAYYDMHKNTTVEPLHVERFFGFGFGKTVLGDIPLSGRIDRIDWVDRARSTVRVIDYKTGKSRSVGDIEGKTAFTDLSDRERALPDSIRGAYKRQLLFYKLLTQLDQSFGQTVVEGVFDFVEPDKRTGKQVIRVFELPDEEVNDLKGLIRDVMGEIRSLKFLEK